VKCEHSHAGMKRYNSVTAVYRNRVTDFDDRLMLNAASLWNFYLDSAYKWMETVTPLCALLLFPNRSISC
jgi:hypothetical protein